MKTGVDEFYSYGGWDRTLLDLSSKLADPIAEPMDCSAIAW
jgi:hypothetical protein